MGEKNSNIDTTPSLPLTPRQHITNKPRTPGLPPPGPSSTNPRRPISYAERLLLASSPHKNSAVSAAAAAAASSSSSSPLQRAMLQEGEAGDGGDIAMPLSPLLQRKASPPPPHKRPQWEGDGKKEAEAEAESPVMKRAGGALLFFG